MKKSSSENASFLWKIGLLHDMINGVKSYSQSEILTFCQFVQEALVGARLQEVFSAHDLLVLGFFRAGMKWLIIDLHQTAPLGILLEGKNPIRKTKNQRPVVHFLKSHAEDGLFQSAEVLSQKGRVLLIKIQKADAVVEIEAQLIPHQPNLTVRSQQKSIHWSKPLELPEQKEFQDLVRPRDLRAVQQEWLNWHDREVQPMHVDQEKIKLKKQRAIEAIQKTLSEDKASKWQEVGELLKLYPMDSLAGEWKNYLELEHSQSWNMENAFAKAKQARQKIQGTIERLSILQQELLDIDQGAIPEGSAKSKNPLELKQDSGIRARKLVLRNSYVAYIGKSGKDNIDLLRTAQPWDLWMHLHDYPGAHLILRIPRGAKVTDADLQEVGQWFVRETLRNKPQLGQYELLVTERRFVRPIKGDSLGRVNYQNEKRIRIKL